MKNFVLCCYPSLTVQGVEMSREDEDKWVIAWSRNFEGVASINGVQWRWPFSFKGPVDNLAAMPSDILFVNEKFCFYRGRIQSYMVFSSDDDVIMHFWRYWLAEIACVSRWQHSMLYAWIHAKEAMRNFVSLSRIWTDSHKLSRPMLYQKGCIAVLESCAFFSMWETTLLSCSAVIHLVEWLTRWPEIATHTDQHPGTDSFTSALWMLALAFNVVVNYLAS